VKVVSRPSPNRSERHGVVVDTIVVHSTGGTLPGALSWLCNPESRVSAHYVIARDGTIYKLRVSAHYVIARDGTIYKLVPLTMSAWHAGYCPGFPNANRRSVGIEMEQVPNTAPTPQQYDALKWLVAQIRTQFPTIARIVGHKEINPRKIDPYLVDMQWLRRELGA